MRGEEEVGLVSIDLRTLMLEQCVFDGQLVQVEFARDLVQDRLFGRAQIDPYHKIFVKQEIGYLGDRKVTALEHALAICTCLDGHGQPSTSFPLTQVTRQG